MKRILIVLSLFATSIMTGGAQNIATATIEWSSGTTFHAADGNATEESTLLVTFGSSRIEWRNSNGTVRGNYQILEVIKGWSNVNEPGSAQYKISDGENGGMIVIENTEGVIKAQIVIGSEQPALYELTIISYEVL